MCSTSHRVRESSCLYLREKKGRVFNHLSSFFSGPTSSFTIPELSPYLETLYQCFPEKLEELLRNSLSDSSLNEEVRVEMEFYIQKRSFEEGNLKSLRHMEQKYKELLSIMSSFNDLVFVMDDCGYFTEFYQPDNIELAMDPRFFLHKKYCEVLPPDVSEKVLLVMEKKIDPKFEYQIPVDGKLVWFEALMSRTKDLSGRLGGWTIVCRNIDQRKLASQELELKEKRLRAMLNSITEGIIAADSHGIITMVNPAAERLLGKKEDGAVGSSITSTVCITDGTSPVPHKLEEVLKGKVIEIDIMKPLFLNDRPIVFTATPIEDELKRITGIVVVIRDLTMNNKLSEAEASAESMQRFLSVMSHELRTPLSGILGALESVGGLSEEEKRSQIDLKMIQSCGYHMMDIVTSTLDYSKITSGVLVVEEIPFNINDVLEEVAAISIQRIGSKPVSFTRAYPLFQSVVVGDPTKLKQILLNLTSNAIKFTESGTVSLFVTAQEKDEKLDFRFQIVDTGIGISEDAQCKIFKPFAQAETSTSRRFGGTGLGLVISQTLAKRMGGSLTFKSELGSGSTFFLSLPFQKPQGNLEKQEQEMDVLPWGFQKEEALRRFAEIPPETRSATRILLIEDTPSNQVIFCRLMAREGFTNVVVCNDGQVGLNEYTGNGPSGQSGAAIIFCDRQMPHYDGIWASQNIRLHESENKLPRVPIVALSASADEETKRECFKAGMTNFLSKPTKREELNAMLGYYLTFK